jgi:hypothetical protein
VLLRCSGGLLPPSPQSNLSTPRSNGRPCWLRWPRVARLFRVGSLSQHETPPERRIGGVSGADSRMTCR